MKPYIIPDVSASAKQLLALQCDWYSSGIRVRRCSVHNRSIRSTVCNLNLQT